MSLVTERKFCKLVIGDRKYIVCSSLQLVFSELLLWKRSGLVYLDFEGRHSNIQPISKLPDSNIALPSMKLSVALMAMVFMLASPTCWNRCSV